MFPRDAALLKHLNAELGCSAGGVVLAHNATIGQRPLGAEYGEAFPN